MTKTNQAKRTERTATAEEVWRYIDEHLEDPEKYMHKIARGLKESVDVSYTLDHQDLVAEGWGSQGKDGKASTGLYRAGELGVKNRGTDLEVRNFANFAWQFAKGAMTRAIHEKSGAVRSPEYINQLRKEVKELQHRTAKKLTVEELLDQLKGKFYFDVTRERILKALEGGRTWNHRDIGKDIDDNFEYHKPAKEAGDSQDLEEEDEVKRSKTRVGKGKKEMERGVDYSKGIDFVGPTIDDILEK